MTVSPFCGRTQELTALLTAWERVSSGNGPHITILLAESGLGKTRLTHELFTRISNAAASPDTLPRYWPEILGAEGNNLRVNPDPSSCDPTAPMPFLWWGLRLVDPLSRNCVAAGVLSSHYERDLQPHLEQAYRRQRQQGRTSQVLDIGKGLALDIAADFIPFAGLAKSVGEAALELRDIYKGARSDNAPVDLNKLGEQRQISLNEKIINDLTTFFSAPKGTPQTPAIILIDDAQFSAHDPGMVAFVDTLCQTMIAQAWPVLLIVNHWEREWGVPIADDVPTIAGCLHFHLSQTELAHDILRLRPIDDLGPMLDRHLPGLTQAQRDAILNRVDGNPRFLDEIIRLATSPRGRGLFEGRNPNSVMTEKGLTDLLERSVALHDLVADRLAESPEAVQQAVSLASLQGVEFLNGLIGQTASQLSTDSDVVSQAVFDAASPHAYVAQVQEGLGAFAQRIYYEVAREHLPSCFDPDEAMVALTDAIREILEDHRYKELSLDEYLRFLALVAGLFETSTEKRDLFAAAWALHNQMQNADRRGDIIGSYVLAQRLLAVLDQLDDNDQDADLRWLRAVYSAASQVNDWDTQERVLDRLLRMTRATYADDANQWSAWMLAEMLTLAAGFYALREDSEAIQRVLSEAIEVLSPWPIEEADFHMVSTWDSILFRKAIELIATGAFTEAIHTLDQVLALTDRMRELNPENGLWRFCRTRAEIERGIAAYKNGETEVAKTNLESAVQTAREMVSEHPIPMLSKLLIGALSELASILGREGDLERPNLLLEEAMIAARALHEATDIEDHREILAEALMRLALHADRMGNTDLTRHYAQESLEMYKRNLNTQWPPWSGIGLAHDLIASVELAVGNVELARAHITEAIRYGEADAQRAGTYSAVGRLLIMLATLVSIERRRGDDSAAERALAEADALWARLPESMHRLLRNTRESLDNDRTVGQERTNVH
jgi:hypothetical protein